MNIITRGYGPSGGAVVDSGGGYDYVLPKRDPKRRIRLLGSKKVKKLIKIALKQESK